MFCWGSAANGELGLNINSAEIETISSPQFNDCQITWEIKQVSAGLTHTLFLTNNGVILSSGNNEVGQLGHNSVGKLDLVQELSDFTILQVATGDQHSLALNSLGNVYAWGDNGLGQLGIPSIESHTSQPKLIKTLTHKNIVQISCGSNHSFALSNDGELYSWGMNINGQLGLNHKESPINKPTVVSLLSHVPIIQIVGGGQHSAALTHSGYILTWGSNKYGQLGCVLPGDAKSTARPIPVPNLSTYSEPMKFIALGDSHTVVLDKQGKLWTFGDGKYGQLGHGNYDSSAIPRSVFDFIGSKVDSVSCGRSHTLVYVSSKKQLYAFGEGTCGQIGCRTLGNSCQPRSIVGPWARIAGQEDTPEDVHIVDVFAGGDVSFAITTKDPNSIPSDPCKSKMAELMYIMEHKVNELLGIGEEDMMEDELFTYCESVFKSGICWMLSFLKPHFEKSSLGLDYRLAEEYISKLSRIKHEAVQFLIKNGIESICQSLPFHHITPETMRLFIIIAMTQEFKNVNSESCLQILYASVVMKFSKLTSTCYGSMLHQLPTDFLRSLVNVYRKIVAKVLNASKERGGVHKTDADHLIPSLKVLQIFYQINRSQPTEQKRMLYQEFYISEISEHVDLEHEYHFLVSHNSSNFHPQLLFCEYPFLFDSTAKTRLLRIDASKQMAGAIFTSMFNTNPLMNLMHPENVQFLNLIVRRTNLVEDAIFQLKNQRDTDLKRPLKITFHGEEAVDAGGVTKEFFILLIREILNPDYGMFIENPETYRIWFREAAFETDEMFSLIGTICGLAIYNWTIINIPFPLALYKKLLNVPITLDDINDYDPVLHKGLRSLLEYEGDDVEDVFYLNFSVEQDYFGEKVVIPLKEGYGDTPVTSQNKHEYVKLLIDYKFNEGIKQQYKAFHRGFYRVCSGGIIKLFQPEELMHLVTGNEDYDWDVFEKNTQYKGGYSSSHPTIKYFWEVFHALSLENKKKFLLFLNGTDRIPILGMSTIKMTIEKTNDEKYLPVAHTCVAQLDLPTYSTKEKLAYKLGQAIKQCEGFGLV